MRQKTLTKEEFIDRRTRILSRMLDNPVNGIYPTTVAFAELDDLYDELVGYDRGPSWAQIERDNLKVGCNHAGIGLPGCKTCDPLWKEHRQ